MHDIFINYRTGDQELAALLLDQTLSHRYGPEQVFLDNRSLIAGRAFDTRLLAAVRGCVVVLSVIGQEWLSHTDESGRRLIDRKQDWVRLEIAEALTRDIPIIPVLIEDTPRLDPSRLPASIRQLAKHQFVRLRHRSFHSDINHLVTQLGELHPQFAAPPAPCAAGAAHRYQTARPPRKTQTDRRTTRSPARHDQSRS